MKKFSGCTMKWMQSVRHSKQGIFKLKKHLKKGAVDDGPLSETFGLYLYGDRFHLAKPDQGMARCFCIFWFLPLFSTGGKEKADGSGHRLFWHLSIEKHSQYWNGRAAVSGRKKFQLSALIFNYRGEKKRRKQHKKHKYHGFMTISYKIRKR